MFKLGCKFLFSRKSWLVLLVFTLTLVISSILSIFSASETIRAGLLTNAYSQYGEHSGILLDVVTKKSDLEKGIEKVGAYQLIDFYHFGNKDKKAVIGRLDEDALELSHIKIKEGRFPEEKNEVAIESAYLNLIDKDWKIGETKTLQGENQRWQFKLVGILDNYSSRWYAPIDLEQGVYAFPNIFMGTYAEPQLKSNYLVKLEGDKNTAMEKMDDLLNEYKGFENFKLFDEGLKHYDAVRNLSIIFQSILIFISTVALTSIFTYFNRKQMQKIGILKAIGVKDISLYKIYCYQAFILFLTSLVLAIPLQYVFKTNMIRMSFIESLESSYPHHTYVIMIGYFVLLFLWILIISLRSVFFSKHLSIRSIMAGKRNISSLHHFIEKKIKPFALKQLLRQLFLFPKEFTFTVSIICLSILVFVFSIVLQKESEGIWDVDEYYYLNSQEIYRFDMVDHLPVLFDQRLTFSEENVMKLTRLPGVKHVEKNPFLEDVVPLIGADKKTIAIDQWINQNGGALRYKNKWIIPNVKYEVVDEKEFKQVYPEGDYEDFKGKILLFVPSENGTKDSNLHKLIGEELSFVKLVKEEENIRKIEQQFEVYDARNEALVKHLDGMKDIRYDKFTIVIAKSTLEDLNLFVGYHELDIFLEQDIKEEEFKEIDDNVNQLMATVPGSLLQNIPEFIQKETSITSLLRFLGIFSFVVASLLTLTSIIIIVFSKYQLQRKDWGIYLSMGMSKRKVYHFLTAEMVIYYILATIIGFIVFITVLLSINLFFPISFYLYYFFLSILFLFILFMIGSRLLYQMIAKQSILSLLREVE
ncbi:ABC transporter permease [Robertmurraya sp. DFI.2.37]|uniref:FtsX-like permease family protein n=1 Tax=Robertmurraya sp. DFI.2.37 TaxID=3031819 RepID=UPI0012442B15|nr:ABC transporter permease [Robertmurraya sp. DFI.2.37]MDF1509002.1 ABC transporter permease [Robertmurraya sp. DFI.2.37]